MRATNLATHIPDCIYMSQGIVFYVWEHHSLLYRYMIYKAGHHLKNINLSLILLLFIDSKKPKQIFTILQRIVSNIDTFLSRNDDIQ
jgi:hypothetical protein